MEKITKKINYTKWSFIIGTPITLAGVIAAFVTVPEISCIVGWRTEACDIPIQEVKLYVQSEDKAALSGVKIQVIGEDAPETQYTDTNGYAEIRVASKGDVRITLSKQGYPVQDISINLETSQPTVRIIRLSPLGKPEIKGSIKPQRQLATTHPSNSLCPSSNDLKTSQFCQSNGGIFFAFKECKKENELLKCEFLITNKKQDQELYIYGDRSNISSRAIDLEGNQFTANNVEFGSVINPSSVRQNLVKDIGLKAFITFNNVTNSFDELALIEVSAWTKSDQEFTIQFRDIPSSMLKQSF